ncbi:hypothetical protein [Streptomyces sp. 7N604]|uniref:hypothetical protein n=1 Tax=Streptomyces sp. 7N604 TaxID=3457415 RepID=UPI003FD0BB00
MAADIAQLLELGKTAFEPSDGMRADDLAGTLRRLLRPRCGYGYRYKRYDGCPIEVSTPGEPCAEHTEWPSPDGADPDPDRCPGTPLHGKGTVTWVAEGTTVRLFGAETQTETSGAILAMRCPYPRRSDGSPCALHAPRPEDRCGWADSVDAEPCAEITALYGCPTHYFERLARETKKIRLSVPCTYCGAEQGRSCTGRTESYNDHVHAVRKKRTDRQVEDFRRSRRQPPARGQVWELASSSRQAD